MNINDCSAELTQLKKALDAWWRNYVHFFYECAHKRTRGVHAVLCSFQFKIMILELSLRELFFVLSNVP